MEEANGAVIRVGDGRGFVVAGKCSRFIITAAHCLPFVPPCASFLPLDERTYVSLLGPLGKEPSISAECLFADPIGDIAVLGPPDGEDRIEEAEGYEKMVGAVVPFSVSEGPARDWALLLSLNGRWFECNINSIHGGSFWISDAEEPIRGGMSGSPILAMDGSAIGVVCAGTQSEDGVDLNTGGPNTRLFRNLPGWLLREWKRE